MDKGPAKYSTQALFLFLAKSIQALANKAPDTVRSLRMTMVRTQHPPPSNPALTDAQGSRNLYSTDK